MFRSIFQPRRLLEVMCCLKKKRKICDVRVSVAQRGHTTIAKQDAAYATTKRKQRHGVKKKSRRRRTRISRKRKREREREINEKMSKSEK